MLLEVSNGEIVDKYTILKIKSERIADEVKLQSIIKELTMVGQSVKFILEINNSIQQQIDELYEVNKILWDIENAIREKEFKKEFDDEFIRIARSVYINNDTRSKIKSMINEKTNSNYVEVKHYSEYSS
jgi:hypothetical protein